MPEVRFAAHRDYEKARVDTSNAMMALLAGSQLAAHLLKLTEGSDRLLPEVFPRVEHIGRFNLTTDAAQLLLDDADQHLGAMGVPYALALHEDYLKTCLSLLESDGKCTAGTAERTKLAYQHRRIESATGARFSADCLTQVTTLRRMRNCTIHAGGRADVVLVRDLARWSTSVQTDWMRIAKRSPQVLKVGDPVTFGHGELILALAITKRLAREANEQIQPVISRARWADIAIDDLLESDPKVLRAPDRQRRAEGLARFHYAPLKLTTKELASALARR